MKNIEWIFFDMGYTLVNEDKAHQARIDYALKELEKHGINNVTSDMIWNEIYLQASEGVNGCVPGAISKYTKGKAEKYNCKGEEPFEDALLTLKQLKKKNYKIGIIANQPLGSRERLKEYGLIDYIDSIFASADLGISKPDIRLFRIALENVGCSAGNAVMVGDRPDNDIEPAASAGMKTVRILQGTFKFRKDTVKPDYTIDTLSQLCDIF